MYCKDCKWFVAETREEYSMCENYDKFSQGGDPEEDGLAFEYDESGNFLVGRLFGCVHFEKNKYPIDR